MNTRSVPTLSRLGEADIVAFMAGYKAYARDIEEMNRDRPKTQLMNTRSLVSCVKESLWSEIQRDFAKVDEKHEADPDYEPLLGDERLRAYLKRQLKETSQRDSGIHLRNSLSTLRLDMEIQNVTQRATQFRADLSDVLKRAGFNPDDWFGDEVKFLRLAKMLVDTPDVLRPLELRSWMKMSVEQPDRSRMSISEFSDELAHIAEHLDVARTARQLSIGYGFRNAPGGKKKKSSQRRSPATEKRKRDSKNESANHDNPQNKRIRKERSGRSTRRAPRVVTCWGCEQEGHVLNDCTIVTDEAERQRIVRERRQKRRQSVTNKESQQYMDLISCRLTGDDTSKFTVRLNNRSVSVILDNGSDRSIVSHAWLQDFLRLSGGDIPLFKLQQEKRSH